MTSLKEMEDGSYGIKTVKDAEAFIKKMNNEYPVIAAYAMEAYRKELQLLPMRDGDQVLIDAAIQAAFHKELIEELAGEFNSGMSIEDIAKKHKYKLSKVIQLVDEGRFM